MKRFSLAVLLVLSLPLPAIALQWDGVSDIPGMCVSGCDTATVQNNCWHCDDPGYWERREMQPYRRWFKSAVGNLAQVSPSARALGVSTSPRNITEMKSALDRLYDAASTDYVNLYNNEVEPANARLAWLSGKLPALESKVMAARQEVAGLNARIDTLSQQTAALEAKTQAADEQLSEMEALSQGIADNRYRYQRMMAYLQLFSPDKSQWQYTYESAPPPPQTVFTGMETRPPAPVEPMAPAAYALTPVSWGDVSYEWASKQSMPNHLPGKLQMTSSIASGLEELSHERASVVPKAAAAQAKYESLHKEYGQLSNAFISANHRITALQTKLAYATQVAGIADRNQQNGARQFMSYMVYDYAQDVLKEKLVETLEDVLNVHGIEDIPLDNETALRQMINAGKSVALPHDRFQKEWDAFIRVQQRTLNLVNRTTGFMSDAARLAAEGTPEEMQEYLDNIFHYVKWETVEYVKDVGMSSVPDESEDFFSKTFGQYVNFRKSQDSVE